MDARTFKDSSQGKGHRTLKSNSQREDPSTSSVWDQNECKCCSKMVRHILQSEHSEERQTHVKDERLLERWRKERDKKGKSQRRKKRRKEHRKEEQMIQQVGLMEEVRGRSTRERLLEKEDRD